MEIMKRIECINILNRLQEFNLLTKTQAEDIINKRDKQKKNLSEELKKLKIKRKIRYCSWCEKQIKGSGTFFCSRKCSNNKGSMNWNIKEQCYVKKTRKG